jgi:TatD DNase family protein
VIEYFDSHCHLTDAAFREDREAVLLRASEAGVTRIVTIASDVADAGAALEIAHAHGGVWCTAGVHPHEAGKAKGGDMDMVRELAETRDEVVAIGETGLDFHYDHSPRGVQADLFEAHLAIGGETGLPVIVHAREADAEIAAAMRNMPRGTMGVLHCFTGGAAAFAEAMAAGWYVSFSGIASFASFRAADLLREVPEDRILIETDSPYLAPVPHRGKRNEPAFVVRVAEAVARHLGVSAGDVARRSTENARRFYGVA